MDIQGSKTILYLQRVEHLTICPKFQFSIIPHKLSDC